MTSPARPVPRRPAEKNATSARLRAVLAGLGGALSCASCQPAATTNTYAPPPPPKVSVAHPVYQQVNRYFEYTGPLSADATVQVRARVPGFLVESHFENGSLVEKDQLLFVIDKRTYQAAVDEAEAQLIADEAAARAAETDAKIAEDLASQRAGSELDALIKAGERDAARAKAEASRAKLESARVSLGFCEVRAPCDGRIGQGTLSLGNLVGAGEATLLATIITTHKLSVSVFVSESDFLLLHRAQQEAAPGSKPGQTAPGQWRPAELALMDSDEFTVQGRVDYVDPFVDPKTGTIKVACVFDNKDGFLVPGMFARVRILLDTSEELVVPDSALLAELSGRYALVLDAEDRVEARPVKVGPLDGSMRVVLEGLSTSDLVVVKGLHRARPGMEVEPTLAELEVAAVPAAATGVAAAETRK